MHGFLLAGFPWFVCSAQRVSYSITDEDRAGFLRLLEIG